MKKRSFYSGVFFLFLSFSVHATVVGLISVAELAEKSSLIVMGVATKKHSYYNTDSTMILTDVHIKITNKIRGECEDEIVVLLEGGTVGKTTTFVLGRPEFAIGKEVLLCIDKIKNTNKYRIFGFNQGKFDIKNGKAYRDFKNTTFIARSNLKLELDKASEGMNLNELVGLFKSGR